MRRNRRAAIAARVALALLPSAALPDAALTVGKAVPTASVMLPANFGQKLGIFQRHGLDVRIADFAGGSKLFQAMSAGNVDIGVADGTGMVFATRGAPLLAMCEDEAQTTPSGIGVPRDPPIRTLDGLKGKRIGISSPGSFTDWLATKLVRERGWGPDGITKVALGSSIAGTIAAFRTHAVDAYISPTAAIFAMEEKRAGRLL